jgi:hypothetical protein
MVCMQLCFSIKFKVKIHNTKQAHWPKEVLGSPAYVHICNYISIGVRPRGITFPSPLFMHCPQCNIYICTNKSSKIYKNMWVFFPHSIFMFPGCFFRVVPGPLDLYQIYDSIPELFGFLVQNAYWLYLEFTLWLYLNHIPINDMISIRYILFE